jgi:hypothetical protein
MITIDGRRVRQQSFSDTKTRDLAEQIPVVSITCSLVEQRRQRQEHAATERRPR